MLDFLHQNEKVCIASFEMKPRATLARMAKQASGGPHPTAKFVDAVISHAQGKLWLYDRMVSDRPRAFVEGDALRNQETWTSTFRHLLVDESCCG
jgi:hypothetical protein